MGDLLGTNGSRMAEVTRIGTPVPPGFRITTEACRAYYRLGNVFPAGLWVQTMAALQVVERTLDRALGDVRRPLLISVRPDAKVSMPGMPHSVLNIGLNEDTLNMVAREAQDARFAYDSYRCLIQTLGQTAMGVNGDLFERVLRRMRRNVRVSVGSDLDAAHLEAVVERFLDIYWCETGEEFPRDPQRQLRTAIEAAFRSGKSAGAIAYRHQEGIPDEVGTAVNIQAMAYGSVGERPCSQQAPGQS